MADKVGFSNIKDYVSSEGFKTNILTPWRKIYEDENILGRFFGSSPNSGVVHYHEAKGHGFVKQLPRFDKRPLTLTQGSEIAEGRGKDAGYSSDTITAGVKRLVGSVFDFKIKNIQTGENFEKMLIPSLKEDMKDARNNDLLQAIFGGFDMETIQKTEAIPFRNYTPRGGANVFSEYYKGKIENCKIDKDMGSINSNRVLLGGGLPIVNGNDLMGDRLTALNTAAGNDHKFNLSNMRNFLNKARYGGSVKINNKDVPRNNIDNPIKPLSLGSVNGYNNVQYTIFVCPKLEYSMVNDAEIKDLQKRPLIENKNQPSYYRFSNFLFNIHNTDVIVCPELSYISDYLPEKVGVAVLIGANAVSDYTIGLPEVFTGYQDAERHVESVITYYNGVKATSYPSGNKALAAKKVRSIDGLMYGFFRV